MCVEITSTAKTENFLQIRIVVIICCYQTVIISKTVATHDSNNEYIMQISVISVVNIKIH